MGGKPREVGPLADLRRRAEEKVRQSHLANPLPDDPAVLKQRLFEAEVRVAERELAGESEATVGLSAEGQGFRGLAESAPVGLFLVDAQGEVCYANPAALAIVGLTMDQVRGNGWTCHLHPDDRDSTMAVWREAVVTHSFRVHQCRFRRPEGLTTWVEGRLIPTAPGGFLEETTVLLGILQDISDRHRAEAQLAGIEKALGEFMDAMESRHPFEILLETVLAVTDSEVGFIREIDANSDGGVITRNLALANASGIVPLSPDDSHLGEVPFHFNLANEPARLGQVVITNQPGSHPSSRGLPAGHPPMNSFLGIPIIFQGKIQGVVGIANRPGGYDLGVVEFLKPFITGCAGLIRALKFRRDRESLARSLRESEAKARALIDAPLLAMVLLSPDGTFLDANPGMARNLGVPLSEVIGKKMAEVYPPEVAAGRMARLAECVATRRSVIFEDQRAGRWFSLFHSPVLDASGEVTRVVGGGVDITERKKAEQSLRESEARLASLLAIAEHPCQDLTVFLDLVLEHLIADTGSQVGYLFRYDEDRQEFRVNTWSKVARAQCSVPNPPTVFRLAETGIWGEVVRQRRPILLNDFPSPHPLKRGLPPGHVQLTRFLSVPVVVEGRLVGVAGVGNKERPYDEGDIQHLNNLLDSAWRIILRHEAEDALRASEILFESVLNALPDWIHVVDERMRILFMNQSFLAQRQFLPDPDGVVGKTVREVFPFLLPQVEAQMATAMESGKPVFTRETTEVGGRAISTETLKIPLEAGGRHPRLVTVIRDVTERFQQQAAILKAKKEWERTFDAVPDLIAILGPDRRVIRMNRAMAEKVGCPSGGGVGRRCFELFHNTSEPPLTCPHDQLLREGKEHMGESKNTCFEGEYLVSASPIHDENGHLVGSVHVARDITEVKQAERALEESREKYRLLFTRMANGFALHELIWDHRGRAIDYRYLEVNPAFEQMMDLRAADVVGRTALEVQPGLEMFWIQTYGRVAQTGENFHFEQYSPNRGRYFEISAFRPRPGQVAVLCSDITHRRLMEDALFESEEKYRTLVENLEDPIIRFDAHLRFVYLSPSALAIVGLAMEDLVGRLLDEVPLASEIVRTSGILRECLASGKPRTVQASFEVAGAMATYEARVFPEVNEGGTVVSLLVIARDVTAVQQAQNELRQSEERFKALTEAAGEGIVMTRDGKILDCNPLFVALAGASKRESLLGKPVSECFPEPWQAKVLHNVKHHLEEPYEVEMQASDGTLRWVRILPKETIFRGEKVRVAALLDLTEQKKAAERLRQSNERLHALASQLETVREEEKERVSRQVHDDLGQVLTGLKIEINRLAQWLGKPNSPEDLRRFRDKVREMGALADEAIGTVRLISRELRPSLIDDLGLGAAIDWQMNNFQERSGLACDLRLALRPTPDFPSRVAIGIFRILQEALTNILRHARARRVTVRLFRRNHRLVLLVHDDGVGIGKVQLDSSRSLGIIGMSERARQMGGTLTLEGKRGKGTLVRLEVPEERLRRG